MGRHLGVNDIHYPHPVNEMLQNGIVAVGDISNTDLSFSLKDESNLFYHTFLEVFGNDDNKAMAVFKRAEELLSRLNGKSSIVPHAPYSVSKTLFKKITERAYLKDSVISMHNQETRSENQLFLNGSGELKDRLEKLGVEVLFQTLAGQPGKPTLFGKIGNKRIFGLPGNPV